MLCYAHVKALRGVPGAKLRIGGDGGARPTLAPAGANHSVRRWARRYDERERTAATRVSMRGCKLCLVPPGITSSSRRFYEALVARCVPLLVADSFVPAFGRPRDLSLSSSLPSLPSAPRRVCPSDGAFPYMAGT